MIKEFIVDGAIHVHQGDGSFGVVTVRDCIGCGCLVPGGPTRCLRCAKEYEAGVKENDCPGDGMGRQEGLKIPRRDAVRVRIPPRVPKNENQTLRDLLNHQVLEYIEFCKEVTLSEFVDSSSQDDRRVRRTPKGPGSSVTVMSTSLGGVPVEASAVVTGGP